MSNLYKRRYTVTSQNQCCVINSNQALAQKLELLAQHERAEDGFVEGLSAIPVAVEEPVPSLEEVRAEAEQILANARQRAEQLVEEARGQVQKLQEAAKADGEKKGYEAGRQAGLEELEVKQQKVEQHQQELERQYQQQRDELESQIVDTVCQVFGKIFHVQFDNNREILLHLVKNAILKIESSKEFQIRVGEKNYQYLEEHKREVLSRVGQNIVLEISADASLDETQCVIETDSGFFDCSIDVQLENLVKAIRTLSM